ncbi:hypothetical protein E4K64_25400 [Bradyrhizobium frederickii]|uniref:Uncharacterized protein n=1 Tax=Bradyrhizobium frederickii TaxID=2560054 RepID=A0A4Y9NWR0_9BRAD|nr:hypothetical protein [Bradyrhizobium frederickii]TFV71668.1 hypothetical protein E4K64_25400 [Bradyrhizobium frederickii]
MPLLSAGEYRPDVSDYLGTASRNVLNVVPRGDGYGPFLDFSPYTSALGAACRGAFYALKSDGSVVAFAATSTKLYRLNNTDYSWVDVSKGAGTYSSLNSTAQWQYAQFGNLVFATQANAVLQVYDLSSSTQFDDCAGSPPQAAYISVVGRFLVLSGLLSNPYRIQWSGLNATTTWTSGVNSSDYQDFPDGGIVRGVAGGEYGVVFQDQAIRRMSYVAGAPYIFQIDRITQDKGLYAPYSIIRAGEKIFFFAGQGFHKIEPGGVPEPIGREKVDRTFLTDLDKGNLQLFIGAADPRSTRVFWAYKSSAGAIGTAYDKVLGYDFLLDRFFPVETSGEYLIGMSQSGVTLESLDSISGSIDAMSLSLDAYATAVQPELAQFSNSHILGFFRGNALEATIESAEQGTDENRLSIRGFRPVTDAATLYGSLSYRDTPSAASINGAEVLVNARTGRCDMMRDARYSRYKVRIPASTSWTFFAGVVPDVAAGGAL